MAIFKERLNRLITHKRSLVCVGLDTELQEIPGFLLTEPDPLLTFNRAIIKYTHPYVVAYKLNIAFYESLGLPGWELLERTMDYMPDDVLVIADAKRSDIGNSSRKYAETFFRTFRFDAITVSPYMGMDSIVPFLEYAEKGVFILCLTSNPGSLDFQCLIVEDEPLYLKVARRVKEWNLIYGNCGIVVGATLPENIQGIRELAPEIPFLIPGIGTQGGNLEAVVLYGTDKDGQSALINSGRAIIYAGSNSNFAEAAARESRRLRDRINQTLLLDKNQNLE